MAGWLDGSMTSSMNTWIALGLGLRFACYTPKMCTQHISLAAKNILNQRNKNCDERKKETKYAVTLT